MLRVTNAVVSEAIIHRLDNQADPKTGLELSDIQLRMTTELKDVIQIHIKKAMEDSRIRYGTFRNTGNNIVEGYAQSIFSQPNSFVQQSKNMATSLYQVMISNRNISAADVIVCKVVCDGVDYLALLKLDYKVHYLSEVHNEPGGKYIGVRHIGKGWPELGTRLQKAVFILNNAAGDYDLIVLDRQQRAESSGDVSKFFQDSFLSVDLIADEKSNSKGFVKGVKQFISENESTLPSVKAKQLYNSAVTTLLTTDIINVQSFAESQFDIENPDQEQYIESLLVCLEKQGVTRGEFQKDPDVARQYSRKRIDLDGLRLDVDIRLYDSDKFQFNTRVGNDGKTYADITIRDVEVVEWDD